MKKHQEMIICSLLAMLIGAIVGATAGVFGQLLHLA